MSNGHKVAINISRSSVHQKEVQVVNYSDFDGLGLIGELLYCMGWLVD